jgi:DMSO/TMAO reductase YedYZ heme-binding membrane subunit
MKEVKINIMTHIFFTYFKYFQERISFSWKYIYTFLYIFIKLKLVKIKNYKKKIGKAYAVPCKKN